MDDSTQSARESAGLRELAQRMALRRYAMMSALSQNPVAEPQLFVGRMPPDVPVELPQPEGSRVVGSVVVGDHSEIFLDAAQPAREVLSLYRDRLEAAGWTQPFMGPRGGGFQGGAFGPANSLLYCKGEDGPGLTVQAFDTPGTPTQISLELTTYAEHPEHSPCAQQHMRRHMGRPMSEVFPPLNQPVGAQVRPEGGGGGDDRWYSSAVLQGDLMLADVRADYERQLQDAGWTRLTSGEGGPVAWSSWAFTAKEQQQPWSATLVILQQGEAPRSYFLLLRGEAEGRQSGGGASFSYGPLMAGGRRMASSLQIHSVQSPTPGQTEPQSPGTEAPGEERAKEEPGTEADRGEP